MTTISCIYVRLPNWIGDVCMSLPSLRTLQDSGAPLSCSVRRLGRL
ncbi:heptosyltransferase, partial [Bordetella pertussis]